jgi:hypothetical protein
MKFETSNEPLFLEVEEAKRFLLVMAHRGFRPNDARGPAAPSEPCVDLRGARRIGAFRPIRHADIGASQAHDSTPRDCLLKQ